jgi:low affinity Fe/Cu permease
MTAGRGSPAGQRAKKRIERFNREKIQPGPVQGAFTRFASWSAEVFGSHLAFAFAVLLVVVWLATGPLFGWSDTWQLYANTATTVITYLMVFIIQNTQNRDAKAMHLKLDELLRATPQARQEFMEAEEEDLQEILREKRIVDQDDPAPPKHSEAKGDNGKDRKAS